MQKGRENHSTQAKQHPNSCQGRELLKIKVKVIPAGAKIIFMGQYLEIHFPINYFFIL